MRLWALWDGIVPGARVHYSGRGTRPTANEADYTQMKQDQEPSTAPTSDQVDLVEWYFEQGWTDGLPVVPPTPETVAAMVAALGGDAE